MWVIYCELTPQATGGEEKETQGIFLIKQVSIVGNSAEHDSTEKHREPAQNAVPPESGRALLVG